MSFDQQTGLLRRSGDGGRLTYSVLSDMRVPELEPAGTFDRSIVPDQATAIRTLAVTILTEGRSWPEGWQWTNADVERILPTLVAALRARCTYTLEMYAPAAGQDPVEMFLFETKKGHCEYFAAALVRMCQSIGIRARIVTGYAAGEFNPLANRYVVRASDAHAWVEVEIGPGEWVSYDPTPPGELMYARRSGNSILSRLRQVYEAIEFSWADNIVSFDQGKRKELFGWTPGAVDPDSIRGVRERVTALRRYIRSMLPESPLGVVGVVAGGAALIGGLLIIGRAVYRAVRARRRRGASHRFAAVLSPEMMRATRFYRRAVEALDKVGYRRGPEQGAIEFAERVASARPEAGGLMRGITDDYYGVRYGGQPGSGRGDEQANELIDVLNRKGKV